MSALSRWDPIREATSLRDAMNQLFEQAVMRPGFGPFSAVNTGVFGQMNVLEAEGKYYCQVLLPGVDSDHIDLTVRQNTLTLKVTLPEPFSEELVKKSTYLLREFGAGEFSRSITFPKDVNGDTVEARYERGILTLEIPLAEHAQPKRISIRESEGASRQPQYIEEKANAHEPAQVN
ncbi:MAG: Hsp20/alpha crystallin family protein [Ktedonobacterales bacterium]